MKKKKEVLFKSNVWKCCDIDSCYKKYKESLDTGDFRETNMNISKSITVLLQYYSMKEIKNILSQEIEDKKMKNSYFKDILVIILLTIAVELILDYAVSPLVEYLKLEVNNNIITSIVFFIVMGVAIRELCYIVIDLIKNDSTNFWGYYMERLDIYEKIRKQEIFDL